MVEEEKPDDFIFESIPRSKRESVAKEAEARVTQTVKSALQSYLERYLSHDGPYRSQLDLTAGFSVQFETRLSGPRDYDDPSIYEIQLARYWGELRQKLPCILIVDVGFDHHSPGLGGLVGSFLANDRTATVDMSMLATMPIELQVAAMDETTCSDIRDLLLYILGPLTYLNKAHLVRSDRTEDKWELRLPLEVTPTGLENRNVTDDPKDILWSTSISLEVAFEGIVTAGFAKQVNELHRVQGPWDGVTPIGFRADDGSAVPLISSPSIDDIVVPSEVSLRQHAPIQADWVPAHSGFISDNPRVALVDQQRSIIIPKRPGTFRLLLMDYKSGKEGKPKSLKSWDVKVVPR